MRGLFAMTIGIAIATYAACEQPAAAVAGPELARGGAVASGRVAITVSLLGDAIELVSEQVDGHIELTPVPGVSTAVEDLEVAMGDLELLPPEGDSSLALRDARIVSTAIVWAGSEEPGRVVVPCVFLAELGGPAGYPLPIEIPIDIEIMIRGVTGGSGLRVDAVGVGTRGTFPLALERLEATVEFRD